VKIRALDRPIWVGGYIGAMYYIGRNVVCWENCSIEIRALDRLLHPVLHDSAPSSCCCTLSSNFCAIMAE